MIIILMIIILMIILIIIIIILMMINIMIIMMIMTVIINIMIILIAVACPHVPRARFLPHRRRRYHPQYSAKQSKPLCLIINVKFDAGVSFVRGRQGSLCAGVPSTSALGNFHQDFWVNIPEEAPFWEMTYVI